MDPISATLLTFGAILIIASWIQLLFISFKVDYSWGLSSLFVPPLSYLYCCFHIKSTQSVLVLAGLGSAMLGASFM